VKSSEKNKDKKRTTPTTKEAGEAQNSREKYRTLWSSRCVAAGRVCSPAVSQFTTTRHNQLFPLTTYTQTHTYRQIDTHTHTRKEREQRNARYLWLLFLCRDKQKEEKRQNTISVAKTHPLHA
jgi:hypothetical protein